MKAFLVGLLTAMAVIIVFGLILRYYEKETKIYQHGYTAGYHAADSTWLAIAPAMVDSAIADWCQTVTYRNKPVLPETIYVKAAIRDMIGREREIIMLPDRRTK